MSWKKHFVTYKERHNPSVITGARKNGPAGDADAAKFQSWLPEVYAGQPNRLERYQQYEMMDQDSEINIALDTISEFSTLYDEQTNNPFIIEWHEEPTDSESQVITTILKQWVNINDWNRRLFKTFRNTVKYGDQVFLRDPETWELFFVQQLNVTKVVVDESRGKEPRQYVIKNIDPNFEKLTITQPTGYDALNAVGSTSPNTWRSLVTQQAPSNTSSTSGLNTDIEYLIDANHVVHLALTDGMDIAWPFGISILDPVFKTFKQKELLEDSIIIYRVQRAPERRIFYIDTGDMPIHVANGHVERIKNEIHQRRIPTRTGGGASMLDAQYNPLSILEDYYLPVSADGRGSKVETLPGGENLGQIDDLKYFNNKMARAMRVPSSYLPTGPDDGTASVNDGRVGTAYIQEYRFTMFCKRLQRTIQPSLDREFKLFLKNRGHNVDSGKFELGFVEPQNFSKFREIEIDGARASLFGQMEGVAYMSKRFMMRKYLDWTEEEILENEKKWLEENPSDDGDEGDPEDFADLGDVGVGGGLDGAVDDFTFDEEDIDNDEFDEPGPEVEGESPISGAENQGEGDPGA